MSSAPTILLFIIMAALAGFFVGLSYGVTHSQEIMHHVD